MLSLSQEICVSAIEVINDTIWISTIKSGICVYSTSTFLCLTSWGVRDKLNVFSMLQVHDMSLVLALAESGIYSFSSILKGDFESLQPQSSFEKNLPPVSINVGVHVPPELNIKVSEVWVCSHTRYEFFILNPSNLAAKKEIIKSPQSSTPLAVNHNIMHLQVVKVSGRMKLAVADNWMIHMWDVERREIEREFDCRKERGLNGFNLTGKATAKISI